VQQIQALLPTVMPLYDAARLTVKLSARHISVALHLPAP
jgi:hypothetical protein